MEHDSQFKVSKEIVSVAQITTGSSLSPSIPKFFYNGQISPENKSNKHVKAHSITVHAEMSTARDLQPGVSLFCTTPLPLNVNSPTTPHPQTDPCQRLNMCKNVPETILWIKKFKFWEKKWVKFQTKAQKSSKVHFIGEIWWPMQKSGRSVPYPGHSWIIQESWHIRVWSLKGTVQGQ